MLQMEFGFLIDKIAKKLSEELSIELNEKSYKTNAVFRGYGEKEFFYSNQDPEILEFWRASRPEEKIKIDLRKEQSKPKTLPEFIENTMRNQLIKWLSENNS